MTRARDVANLIGSGNYSSTTFTATAGQTAFTISHTQGFIQVFMNGLLLDETVDYTSNGSAVTLTSGAAAGDEIEVVKYNTFSVGDAIPASGGTFTGNVTHNGNLGIGASPSIPLQVEKAGGGNFVASFQNTTSGTPYGVHIKDAASASNGYPLLQVTNSAGSVPYLKVMSGTGHVLKSNIPYGSANSQTKANASASGGNAKIQLDFNHQSGGGLTIDQTNERMTAPVAGLYVIGFHQLTDVAAYTEVQIRVNGTVLDGGRTQTGNSHQYGGLSALVVKTLSANDYVEWWCTGGVTHNNVGYNNHFMYLLG